VWRAVAQPSAETATINGQGFSPMTATSEKQALLELRIGVSGEQPSR